MLARRALVLTSATLVLAAMPVATASATGSAQPYAVVQSVNKASATDGESVTYTVTVRNLVRQAMPAARFTQDLRGVLDDARVVTLPPGVSRAGAVLSWTGPLAAGRTRTFRTTVRIHLGDGDNVLSSRISTSATMLRGRTCTTYTYGIL